MQAQIISKKNTATTGDLKSTKFLPTTSTTQSPQNATLTIQSASSHPMVEELTSFLSLEDDWDGNGGNRPPRLIVRRALRWLYKQPIENFPDDAMVCPDGSVTLFWNSLRQELDFQLDGRIFYRYCVHEIFRSFEVDVD